MAYIPKRKDEQEDQTNQPLRQTGGAVLSSSVAGGAAQPGQNKRQNFATLQSYLKANKPQGEQFATKLASGLAQTGQEAKTGIEQAGQQVRQAVQEQNINYKPETVQEAFESPTTFVQNPEKLAEFTKYRTAQYGGPQSAELTPEFQKAQTDTQKALERAKLTESEGGRKQLALEAQKSKAGGITALNQALLSTNPQAAAQLQAAAQPFGTLQNLLTGQTANINEQIKQAKEAAEIGRKETGEKLSTAQQDLQQQLLSAATQKREALVPAVTSALANFEEGKATPEELELLGFDLSNLSDQALSKASNNLNILRQEYGIPTDLNTLFTRQSPEYVYGTAESVATPEQFAYEQALEQLAGEPLSILGTPQQPIAPVTPERSALGGLRDTVNAKDTERLMKYAGYSGMYEGYKAKPDELLKFLYKYPDQGQEMLDRVREVKGKEEAEKLRPVLERMGLIVPTTPPPPPPPTPSTKRGLVFRAL